MQKRRFVSAVLLCAMSIFCGAQAFAGGNRFIDDNDTVVLHGNTHPVARSKGQAGLAAANLPMENMIMSLRVPADKETALEQFLNEQKDPSSPNYHRWLTPEEFGAKFGPSIEDVAAVTDWLTSHGFTVNDVSKSRTSVNFSGDVSKVEQTFKTQIKKVQVGDNVYHANATDPSIPRGLSDVVSGIVTLHNIPRKPKNNGAKPFESDQFVPNYTSGSYHYLAPGDFATIYNVNQLYAGGIDGTGQSIAIVGRTNPSPTNWSTFRTKMGLPANPPQVIVNGTDPGSLGSGEDTEANLDVEWAGAVAKNATIKFVTSKSTYSTDGVDLSSQYIVNNNIAPVMSVSFGSCESDMGTTENAFYKNLWAQAAAQGITVLVASGDSGASGCSAASSTTGTVRAVNGLASTPYNIAVGGTQFNEAGGTYWNSVNSTGMTSATGYIPEVAWNESGAVTGGSGLWATGGGVSQVYSKPTWQAAPGVPQDGKRDLPDVSLTAASHDGYIVYTNGALSSVGGTSAASPSFAGLMALVVQKTGQRQGNANPQLYQMANNQYAAGGSAVFNDITASHNSVPGVTGYASAPAYDLATGLGSVNAYNMVTKYGSAGTGTVVQSDLSVTATTPQAIYQGSTGTINVTTTASGGFNSSVALTVSGLPAGVTGTFAPASIAAPGAGSSVLTLTVSSSAAVGTSNITITASGGGITRTVQVAVTIKSGVVYSSSFNDTWYTLPVTGTAGKWYLVSQGANPTAYTHSSTRMAQFGSYNVASGSQSRLYNNVRYTIPAGSKGATLSFWVYHDTGRATYNDRLQAQVTTGSTWVNVGPSVSRYNGTTGWSQVSVDLSAYIGQSIMFGFLGTSGGGYNLYADDVMLTVK